MPYSDAQRAAALVLLAKNKNNYAKTAKESGVSVRTLKTWNTTAPKKDVFELLTEAIARLFQLMPEKWEGRDWGIALGIMLDKWLLSQGESTQRIEHLGDYRLTDTEKEIVGERARELVKEFGSERARKRSGNGPDSA